jgi:hypothetical protein
VEPIEVAVKAVHVPPKWTGLAISSLILSFLSFLILEIIAYLIDILIDISTIHYLYWYMIRENSLRYSGSVTFS